MIDWLDDFVNYHANSETPQRILYWVGISTIAGALRRKVWIQEDGFQWTSNFYIVVVAPPGLAKKSTSIDYGKRLLRNCDDIHFGPNVATWQAIIEELGGMHDIVEIGDEEFESTNMTLYSSEFGSLFDADDQRAIDVLTDIWDGKLDEFRKATKTAGNDTLVNPWINIIGCTTPSWIGKNMPESLIGSGFVCRCIWLYADHRERRVAYPSRNIKSDRSLSAGLISRLRDMSEITGQFKLTDEAYEWGERWYEDYCNYIDNVVGTLEGDFAQRRQTHLHKVAMIVSSARGNAPTINVADMQRASEVLKSVEQDASYIFGFIGQSSQARNSGQIVQLVQRHGWISKKELYKREFFRKLSFKDYESAFQSAIASGRVKISWIGTDMLVGPC